MGGTLRVDPAKLQAAAQAQAEVGTFVSAMAPGQSMTTAATSMPGLLTEGACQFVGAAFDDATTAVHDELTAHSTNLASAADQYRRIDESLGKRLRDIAGGH